MGSRLRCSERAFGEDRELKRKKWRKEEAERAEREWLKEWMRSLPLTFSFQVDGKLFHKQCFRCSMCRKTLPASFVERKGEFLCKPCASGEGEKMTGAAAAIKEVGETCPGCKV